MVYGPRWGLSESPTPRPRVVEAIRYARARMECPPSQDCLGLVRYSQVRSAGTGRGWWLVFFFIGVMTLGAHSAWSFEDTLLFDDGQGRERAISLSELRDLCEEAEIEVDDPYHGRRMRYVAFPLGCVLEGGFEASGGARELREKGLLLRARDGYTRPASGRDLLMPGGYLAFGEPELLEAEGGGSRFRRIDRRQVDPSPFYLVWTGQERGNPHEIPWPYQLVRIEVAPFAQAFPRTVPVGLESSHSGWAGYALFQASCASCHSINGQGGKVGPDLNVPRSIVEYRPVEQIRAYVRNPQSFRYTSMPPHPGLTEADLDALIAYFSAMRERKQDPAESEDS